MLENNPYFVSSPVAGKTYKLWSLPNGSSVVRKGLSIEGRECGPFQIEKQHGTYTVCKTSWGYHFHLDASLDVMAS